MACAHCDLPDELICSKVSSFTADIDLSAVVFAGAAMNLPIATSIDLAVRPPTGPPNSASLLYQTSRRILI
ncbi:MAG: hypothetical protein ACE5E3_05285, partial [Mariprofundus sp.]